MAMVLNLSASHDSTEYRGTIHRMRTMYFCMFGARQFMRCMTMRRMDMRKVSTTKAPEENQPMRCLERPCWYRSTE